jgi:hypothetical protein
MKRAVLFLFLVSSGLCAQVTDNFTDGDFSSNPTWTGMDTCFVINEALQLQLNASAGGMAYLSLPIVAEQTKEWRFWIREAFSPSGNNYTDVYLSSNVAELLNATQGYFLRFGESGSNDAIELFRKDGSEEVSICKGEPSSIATSFSVAVKVLCDADGNWSLLTDYIGNGQYTIEASGTDDTYPRNGFFGFMPKYTTSNATKFFFDDVYVGPQILDIYPPLLQRIEIIDNQNLRLVFDEALDETSALEVGHFFVNEGVGNPSQVSFDGNPAKLKLVFDTPFSNGVNYVLFYNNIMDLSGNVTPEGQILFSFYEAAENDIVINEIMADPSPAVGLPEWEYVELYNVTDLSINLEGWTIALGSNIKTIENKIINPHSYLILCHANAVAEMSQFGDCYGFSSFSITNSGTHLILADSTQTVISELAFDLSWYQDPDKDDGGWALEQITSLNPCAGSNNWKASINEIGGTPGSLNSVDDPTTSIPKISQIIVVSNDSLLLRFDQLMDVSSIETPEFYHIEEMWLSPFLATYIDSIDCVGLKFIEELTVGKTLTLSLSSSITNCIGISVVQGESASFVLPISASEYDIVINEIMADPSPVVGLPEWEYVELYNTTEYDIILTSWAMQIGSDDVFFDDQIIQANSYLIVCHEDAVEDLSAFGDCVGFGSFSIGNSSSSIVLINSEGLVISRVNFALSWYHDTEKSKGGWSVEQIDPESPCAEVNNWTASTNYLGGTPGMLNSVNDINDFPPTVDRVSLFSNTIVQIWFDQFMNTASLVNTGNYVVAETEMRPIEANVNPMDKRFVELIFSHGFEEGMVYTLLVSGVANCVGTEIETNTEIKFGLPNEVEAKDILISEILFDPIAPGVDYVELYNNSDKTFDLSSMMLGLVKQTFPNPPDTTLKEISAESRLFLPYAYVLLSTNSNVVGAQYETVTDNFVEMSSFPQYSANGGNAILLSKEGVLIDGMYFSEKMHYPLIKTTKGVSLERVSFGATSADSWHSAAESVHFGTPGYENSMALSPLYHSGAVGISPEIFSPDGDAYNDVAIISYKLDEEGTMNVYIYNVDGQIIRHLANGELVGQEGSLVWNGLDEAGNRVPVGVYIIVTEVFNFNGTVKTYKNTIVAATK